MLAVSRTEVMQKISAEDAALRGLTVDNHANPPVAYRGPRWDPGEIYEIEATDWKALLEDLVNALSTPGFMVVLGRTGGKAGISKSYGRAYAALQDDRG